MDEKVSATSIDDNLCNVSASIERARALVQKAERVTVLTGAGISTDSGIPDYRGPAGVWTRSPGAQRASTIQMFLSSKDARLSIWRSAKVVLDANNPNIGHFALHSLRLAGKLQLLVTQNVDGLHQDAGQPDDEILEIHGCFKRSVCLNCAELYSTSDVLAGYNPPLSADGQSEYEPHCPECSGILKPNVVLFGEAVPEDVKKRAFDAACSCDLLLCVGSSLSVSPVNLMVSRAKDAAAIVIIVNGSATDMDHLADVCVTAPISVALPSIVSFDDSLGGLVASNRSSSRLDGNSPMLHQIVSGHDSMRETGRQKQHVKVQSATLRSFAPTLSLEEQAILDEETVQKVLDTLPFPVLLR